MLDRPVQTIVVSGEPSIAERQRVEETLAALELGGILSTSLADIESRLGQMGWAREVTVRRHWPDRLEVRLHKVIPVARWGEQDYLAASGEPMQLPGRHPDLPALWAHISSPQQAMEVYRLLQLYAARQNLQIVTLTESPQGEWQVGFAGGMRLLLGARDVNSRMQRFLRAYATALRYRPEPISYADARYTSGIAVRFEMRDNDNAQLVGQIEPATQTLGIQN
ncbi:MAG: FtsQ-type POTRA domain-containing protein [Proteobacteria bacterium]|nr:FtsQ-type POTRA domain-containing protein [Pseudomonadota bacterium]